jgi:hypothetical protein
VEREVSDVGILACNLDLKEQARMPISPAAAQQAGT